MKRIIFLLIAVISIAHPAFSQKTRSNGYGRAGAHYVGFLYSYELAYNQQDILFKPYVARKMSVGISLSNRNKDFLFYAGIGFKGWKASFYNPAFTEQFKEDVIQNYHPINGSFADSLVATSVHQMAQQTEHYYQGGFYAQYIHTGFILSRYRLKPAIGFYAGWENYLLYTPAARGIEPENMDGEYIIMPAAFKEIKTGIDLIGLINPDNEFSGSLELNLGYKWLSYRGVKFHRTYVSQYTNEELARRYEHGGKLTYAISFKFWTNWGDY